MNIVTGHTAKQTDSNTITALASESEPQRVRCRLGGAASGGVVAPRGELVEAVCWGLGALSCLVVCAVAQGTAMMVIAGSWEGTLPLVPRDAYPLGCRLGGARGKWPLGGACRRRQVISLGGGADRLHDGGECAVLWRMICLITVLARDAGRRALACDVSRME